MSSTKQLNQNIQLINNENNDLKYKLLNLINEYKLLKQMVINNDYDNEINDKKRSFQEIEDNELNVIKEDEPLTIIPNEAPSKLQADDIFDFIEDEDLDEEMDSPLLSRTSSPLDDDNTSLMLSLTRSTTISSVSNSTFDTKLNSNSMKFFELPSFQSNKPYNNIFENLGNQFDILKQDKYNLINDFLEEKLIDNDLNYYENLNYQD